MGKKLPQASAKICKNDKKQLNSLIKILKPKVYITDASNFKRLVQELTGNGNPVPCYAPPSSIPETFIRETPVIDIDDHNSSYQERSSLESSSVDSSEASMLTSFTTAIESPQEELCISDTFSALESSLASHKANFPVYGDIESWLLETDNTLSYNCDVSIPTIQQQAGVYNYDFSDLII